MKAEPQRQWLLLDLAALDVRLAQIAHRRSKLPESVEHDRIAAQVAAADDQLVRARTALGDVEREVAKAEADVQLVRDRAARNRARLDSGQGTSKELTALQHELESLARRQNELEEVELAVMERSEELTAAVERAHQARTESAEALERAAAARDAALGVLADEERDLTRRRADVTPGVGDDLLSLYEKVRAQTGLGAAVLSQRRCEGCRLELMGDDLRRVTSAAPDEVVRCEECRRILVRTSESGL